MRGLYLLVLSCAFISPILSSHLTSRAPHVSGQSIMTPQHEQEPNSYVADEAQAPQAQDEDDDNAPMVHQTPRDYRSWALRHREELQREGKEVVLMSELSSHIPRLPDEADADYAKRYSDTMNDMIRRGVQILNDQCTADVAPDMFFVGGHSFDVGPNSGVTKKEYRELSEWFASQEDRGESAQVDVPERFRKFEMEKSERERRLGE